MKLDEIPALVEMLFQFKEIAVTKKLYIVLL